MPYSAPTNSLFSTFDNSAETRISEAIAFNMIRLGRVWQETVLNNEGLEGLTAGVASKNWFVNKVYTVGQVGYGKMSQNDTFLFGGTQQEFGPFGRRPTFSGVSLDPTLDPKRKNVLFSVPIRSQDWMYTKTIGESIYSTNPAMAGDLDASSEMAFAETIARAQCLYWYVNQNDSYSYCKVSSGAWVDRDSGTSGSETFQFQTDNSAIERFNEGELVDFRANTTGYALRNTGYTGYVVAVDPSSNTVEVQFLDSSGTKAVSTDFTISDGDLVVPYRDKDASDKFYGFAGINSYLKSTGNLLGDDAVGTENNGTINVGTTPQFRSVTQAVNGSLTPEVLTRWVSLTNRASRRFGTGIDTIYTTPAVLRQAINEMNAYYVAMGSGSMASAPIRSRGDGGYEFDIDGKTFRLIADQWVEAGALYGTQMGGGNWRRVVPQDILGFKSAPRIPGQIPFRFIAGWYGMPDNAFPIYSTSGSYNQVTEGRQYPGVVRYQVYPQNPVGLKLTGLTEDNVFQSAST